MPFDPNYPTDGSLIKAAEFRAQFAALKALVDGLEARVAALEAVTAGGVVAPGQLDTAIATTANNVNGIDPSGVGASDPPTQAELQDVMNKLAELIVGLHR